MRSHSNRFGRFRASYSTSAPPEGCTSISTSGRTFIVLPSSLPATELITRMTAAGIFYTMPSRVHDAEACWRFAEQLAAITWGNGFSLQSLGT